MLAGFMEERNIRWGELAGGLLIVGASIMLVLSLWDRLNRIPYFPFLAFTAAASAAFGAGLYAHHRWKLESTSRGVLIIATLLIPVAFLVMAAGPQDHSLVIALGIEAGALALFAWLAGLAGRVLVPGGRWFYVAAVLGNAAAVPLIARYVSADYGPAWPAVAGLLSAACFAVSVVGHLWSSADADRNRLDAPRAHALFTLLGTATFALVLALGVLLNHDIRAHGLVAALDHLAVPLALAAMPILAVGLHVARGTARGAALAPFHVAGTSVALLGMTAITASLVLAWPQPLWILVVGTLNAAVLSTAAVRFRLPVLHAGAMACAALTYLIGFHVLYAPSELPLWAGGENLGPTLLQLSNDASSGTALVGLFVLFGLIAEGFVRNGRRRHGRMFAGGCAVVAVVSLMLVTVHGFLQTDTHDSLRATILYAVYGAGGLALAGRWRRAELSYLGLVLLAAAPLWALWWKDRDVGPLWATVLAAEAVLMAVAATVLHRRFDPKPDEPWNVRFGRLAFPTLPDVFRVPLSHVCDVVASFALLAAVATTRFGLSSSDDVIRTAALLAACHFLLAWGYRQPWRTWIGSSIVLLGAIHVAGAGYSLGALARQLLVAQLAHATLAVAAGVATSHWKRAAGDLPPSDPAPDARIRRVFGRPLIDTALASSMLVVPMLGLAWSGAASMVVYFFWLAVIWLVISVSEHGTSAFAAGMFAAHQLALIAAALVGTTAWMNGAWMEANGWIAPWSDGPLHPQRLQAYGVALGLLSLGWVCARIALRRVAGARVLLHPPFTPVDWFVRHAVVVGQWLLIGGWLVPGVGQELLGAAGGVGEIQTAATGPGAWILFGVMSAVVAATLWQRLGRTELFAGLLLAVTLPCLIAGQFAGVEYLAVASALRWGLAAAFVLLSVGVWRRRGLRRRCRGAAMRLRLGRDGSPIAQATLLTTAAVPVLVLTVVAAVLKLQGISPAGPVEGTFFDRIGPSVSYLVPLVLVLGGLIGYAVRERSASYAFAAGLVAELTVVLAYALYVATTGNEAFDLTEKITLLQLATITPAVWAGVWLIARNRLDVWRERPGSPVASVLMDLQLSMAAAGNLLLLFPAVGRLAMLHPAAQAWTAAAGRPLGWAAFATLVAAWGYRQRQCGRHLRPEVLGLVGMSVVGLFACTVQWQRPAWGYRALMVGSAAYAWLAVAVAWVGSRWGGGWGGWWLSAAKPQGSSADAPGAPLRSAPATLAPKRATHALERAAALWVSVAGLFAVGLGLRAAFFHPDFGNDVWADDLIWAAAAIGLASAAGATMAVWQRREDWAFSAALGVNLAASLVVWHYYRDAGHFRDWWIQLLQANAIASAAVALIWTATRRRLYRIGRLTLDTSPLLATQIALPAVAVAMLLCLPVARLLYSPDGLPESISQLADVSGWLALLLVAVAAAWYLRQTLPSGLLHVAGALGLGAGVLAACMAIRVPVEYRQQFVWAEWSEYHTLTVAWTIVAAGLLALGFLGRNLRLATKGEPEDGDHVAILPGVVVQGWVTAVGMAVVVLATIHCEYDPGSPWWSAGVLGVLSVTAGTLAVWRREAAYVVASGLLLNLIGAIAWWASEERTFATLVQANVLCFAAGSAIWSLLRLAWPQRVGHVELVGPPVPYAHAAAGLAVALVLGFVAVFVVGEVAGETAGWERLELQRLDWLALAGAAVAVAICLWDRAARLPLAGLYLLGLALLGMLLHWRNLGSQQFIWTAAAELPGFVIITAAAGWTIRQTKPLWRTLRIPLQGPGADRPRFGTAWFPPLQAVLAGVGAMLAAWIAIDFGYDGVGEAEAWLGLAGRLAGIPGALMLLGAAILMAWQTRDAWRCGWQYAAFAAGLLLNACIGWALLDSAPDTSAGEAPWLHRSVALMVSAAMLGLVSSVGLAKVLPRSGDWLTAGHRATPVFGCLAVMVLVAVLVQEALLFETDKGAPMTWQAIAAVIVVLAALIAGCLAMAVRGDWDPLRLPERRRTVYVYAAEVLAALIGLHVYLSMPELFRWGVVRYWMFIAMGVAFAGAGLSEWFQRLRLPVLSEPLRRTALLLPLVPMTGFWFAAESTTLFALAGRTPAVWFLMGAFYGFMGVSNRSLVLTAVSIATGNVGLWVLWHQQGLGFLDRPQLWLIPPALAVLVAGHLDRRRLTEAQRTSLRYAALSVIYVSSTTEFWRGVGDSAVLPLLTISFSVAGVLAGVLLRIRSFLYLGTTFLTVVIARLIYFAAFEHGPEPRWWIIWSFCILLGAGILTLFAVYEKRGVEIREAMRGLRKWGG